VTAVIVGLLSDTHGNVPRTARAIEALKTAGATAFLHAGDIGGEDVLAEFAGLEAWFVFGNTDDHDPGLARFAQSLGLRPPQRGPLVLELAERRVALLHGHELSVSSLLSVSAERSGAIAARWLPGCQYIVHGHTHVARDEVVDTPGAAVRIINPGALHRATSPSVATLDTQTDELRFWPVR
jgi:uncharacterized protein